MKQRIVRIGRIRIIVPSNVQVINKINLDQLYEGRQSRRVDAALILKYRDRTITTIIEDTGTPEPKDMERLYNTVDELKYKNIVKPDMIIIKVLHHRGIKNSLLVNIARSYRIELQECHKGLVNLKQILKKRKL